MGHPKGQPPGLAQIREGTGRILHREQIRNLRLDGLGPVGHILCHCRHQALIAGAGVVEIGDGLHQQVDIEIRQLGLELTEGTACIAQNHRVGGGAVGGGIHIIHHSPEILSIQKIGLPVCGVVKMEIAPVRALPADVLRHQVDIVHQTDGIAKCVGIHILNQEGLLTAILQPDIDFIGAIHIAHLDKLIIQIRTG